MSSSNDLFDYIIVGAGSAGCTVAARIVHLLPTARVALIESGRDHDHNRGGARAGGGTETSESIADPSKWPLLLNGPADRGYWTEPQAKLNDRRLHYTRGNGVGGSSLVNVMLWSRGFKEDWDERMPTGWSSADVEEDFEWVEKRLKLLKVEGKGLMMRACEAAKILGMKESASGGTNNGIWEKQGASGSYLATITKDGRRTDIYRAIGAHDVRVNLVHGVAEKILFVVNRTNQSKSAEGILLRKPNGEKETIRVGKGGEVILSCGAVDTPKLLQLSGVGPPTLLGNVGVAVVHPLPSVGEGLKDHPMLPMSFQCKLKMDASFMSPNSVVGWINDKPTGVQILCVDGRSHRYMLPQTFVLSRGGDNGLALQKLRDALKYLASMAAASFFRFLLNWIPAFRAKIEGNVGFLVAVVSPKSVGSVMIQSADPFIPPLINPNLLSREEDLKALLTGIARVRKLVEASPLADAVGEELMPGRLFKGDLEHIRANTSPYYHSTGTCAIGTCLDEDLRVIGLSGLRVADASSLPRIPRCQIAASCMVVGAHCGTLVAKKRSKSASSM